MYRKLVVATVLTGIAGLFLIGQPGHSPGQPKEPPAKEPIPPAPQRAAANQGAALLPVTQVALFTSGVGYFERSGEVAGNASIALSFPVSDINDLLKSMVLQDLNGGQIRTVGYDSFDPVEKTLKSFALDLTKNPSFAQLLNQARGEKIEVDTQGQTYKGTVVGVEKQRQPVGKDNVIEVDVVNVLTKDGLRGLLLNQVQRLRFLNPFLEGEFQRALEVLAFSHDTHKRTVSLNFTGEGKRQVRVGYVVENPIWKTSYRLVLDKQTKPFLQGWAIVDNATDEDWNNVNVTLVSGRPISFRMDLYTPLYVPRPLVELEQFAHLRPPVYSGALDGLRAKGADQARRLEDRERAAQAPGAAAKEAFDIQRGVVTAAAGQEVGQFFHYSIKQPVSLPRQKSAMLPIVNQPIEATRYSIYNAAVQAKHPLLGLKLKNTTDLHLMQGPITVFEGSSYAGDARTLDLQPKEERLVSYAVDQATEVEPVAKSTPDRLISVKVVKGILHASYKLRQTKSYNLKNRSTQDRAVLIEHPFRADWTLVAPEKPLERSREVYRFELPLAAGKSASQEVVEEQGRVDQVILSTAADQTIRFYLSSNITSPKVKEALEKAITLKTKWAETQHQIGQVDKQIKTIVEDQVRLRANLERVPEKSPPYQRYLKKLDEQETQIDNLQQEMRLLRQREDGQRKEFEAFLLALDIE